MFDSCFVSHNTKKAKRAAFLIPVLLIGWSCSNKEEAVPEAAAPVQVATVARKTIQHIVSADAALYPMHQADVMPKISAPVAKFLVDRGDYVQAGQLIATLENHDLLAAEAGAVAKVAQAQANLRTTAAATVPQEEVKARDDVAAATQQVAAAQKLVESRRHLYEQGALARKLLDEAEVSYAQAEATLHTAREHLKALQTISGHEEIATAQAQLAAAQADLRSAQAQVAYSEVRSPIGGIVAARPLYPGDMATTGQPLVTIMDVSRVVARANVPQREVNAIHVGDRATIGPAAGAFTVPGRVTVVSPATTPSTTTVEVWVEADNPHNELRPGGTVRTNIVAATIPNAVVVPEAALVASPEGGTVVWTVADGRANPRPVTIGTREGNAVQILSGVAPGQQVITAGALGLEADAKVRIEQSAPPTLSESEHVGRKP